MGRNIKAACLWDSTNKACNSMNVARGFVFLLGRGKLHFKWGYIKGYFKWKELSQNSYIPPHPPLIKLLWKLEGGDRSSKSWRRLYPGIHTWPIMSQLMIMVWGEWWEHKAAQILIASSSVWLNHRIHNIRQLNKANHGHNNFIQMTAYVDGCHNAGMSNMF